MSNIEPYTLISESQYLADEEISPVKREYVDGLVFVRSGTNNRHNLIASTIMGQLFLGLDNSFCRVWSSNAKIRIRYSTHTRFYYPDVSVVCQPNPPTDAFHDAPVLIMEVLSPSTRRIDGGEKLDAYLTIPSLAVVLLVEQDFPAVVVHRRTDQGFIRKVWDEITATIPLPEIGAELPLAEIYEGVEFPPESLEDADEG